MVRNLIRTKPYTQTVDTNYLNHLDSDFRFTEYKVLFVLPSQCLTFTKPERCLFSNSK